MTRASILVALLLLTAAPVAAQDPLRALAGDYVLRGRYDDGAASEALLRIERVAGRLELTRTELTRDGTPHAPARVWRSRAVQLHDAERLVVSYAPPATTTARGLSGAVAGAPAATRRAANELEARYTLRGGRVIEAVRNTTRLAPEDAWAHLQSTGQRGAPHELRSVRTLVDHGAPEERYDIVFVPEGYALDELDRYDARVTSAIDALRQTTPFAELWPLFNVHALRFPDPFSGIRGVRTAAGTKLGPASEPRATPVVNVERVRALAAAAPGADAVVIVANDRFRSIAWFRGDVTAVSAVDGRFPAVVVHELGHVIGRLLDEYEEHEESFCDFLLGNPLVEAALRLGDSGGNVTTHTDRRFIPWRHWLPAGATLPTADHERPDVGLYRGAYYQSRRWYRPSPTCLMRTSNLARSFCAVCRELLVVRIAKKTWPVRTKLERLDPQTVRLSLDPGLAGSPLAFSQVRWLRGGAVVATGPTYVARRHELPWGASELHAVVRLTTPWVRADPEDATTFRARFVLDKGFLWNDTLEVRGPTRHRGLPKR